MHIYIYIYTEREQLKLRILNKEIGNEYQAEFGLHASEFFQTLEDLC